LYPYNLINNFMVFQITINKFKTIKSKPKTDIEYQGINNGCRYQKSYFQLEELALDVTKRGRAFSPAVFNGPRSKQCFVSTRMIVLDFDNGKTPIEVWEESVALGLTPNLMYSTFSDTEEKRRFRVIYIFKEDFTSYEEVTAHTKQLAKILEADEQTDGVKLYQPGKEILGGSYEVNTKDNLPEIVIKEREREYREDSLDRETSLYILEDYYNKVFVSRYGKIGSGNRSKPTAALAGFANSKGVPEEVMEEFLETIDPEPNFSIIKYVYKTYEHLHNTTNTEIRNKLIQL